MNTKLLRLAYRYKNGVREWSVPGYGNAAKLVPARLNIARNAAMSWGASFHWPARDDKGEMVRGVDLDRHRSMARMYARELLAKVKTDSRKSTGKSNAKQH